MESTRPIRALIRGLDALCVLNSRGGATVSEVAQDIRLPRTTVYRILETLRDAGFAFRDTVDDRYRLTLLVRDLSEGFDDETWISRIAKPCVDELCQETIWPVALCTLSGTSMIVREAASHATLLAIERVSPGVRMPLLDSAPGQVYLAFCPTAERDNLVERLNLASAQRQELLRMCADIKTQGYAAVTRNRRGEDEVSVSVPVTLHDNLLAALSVRFAAAAVPLKSGLERFLPKLRTCAATISTLFSELANSAPDAAA